MAAPGRDAPGPSREGPGHYDRDDLVEHQGTAWFVAAPFPGDGPGGHVRLGRQRTSPEGHASGAATDAAPEDVRLIARWADRVLFGDGDDPGWSGPGTATATRRA